MSGVSTPDLPAPGKDNGRRQLVAAFAERAAAAVRRVESGDRGGLHDLASLAAECGNRLGQNDRQTLRLAAAAASWKGELGDPRGACEELDSLYVRANTAFGPTDADSLLLGSNAASFTGIAGDARSAAKRLALMLPSVEQRFGVNSPPADTVRTNLAVWRARSAEEGEATRARSSGASGRSRSDNPLRLPAFRRLWGGHLVSLAGDQIFPIALVALALSRGGHPAQTISAIFAARFVALALFIVIGGIVADRINRITGMVLLDIVRAVAVTGLVLIGTGAPLAVLAGITFVLGAGEAIFTPLYESVLPDIAEGAALQRANSLSILVKNLATVIGPGIAGLLVVGLGARVALIVDVGTFVASAGGLFGLRHRFGRIEHDDDAGMPVWRAAAAGVAVVMQQRWLAALEGMAMIHTLFAVGPWYVLVPVLAFERYGSVAAYGGLLAAFGAGGVVGALAGARVPHHGRGLIALMGIGSFGLACLIEGWDLPIYVVGAVFAVAGFGTQMFDVVKTTAIQAAVERRHLGRVLSLDFFATFVTMPVGQLIGGLVAGHVAATTIMRVCGVIVLVTTVLPALVPGVASFSNPRRPTADDEESTGGPGDQTASRHGTMP